jgi:hypothetical protein
MHVKPQNYTSQYDVYSFIFAKNLHGESHDLMRFSN